MSVDWIAIGSIATAAGVALATGSLFYAGRQLRTTKRVSAGEFLFQIDDQLARHAEVHQKLRPGGAWTVAGAGPTTPEDWIAVERYMGLFERVRVLIEAGVLNLKDVEHFYGYRIRNIVANPVIRVEKLEKRAGGWTDFLWLSHAIETVQA